MLNFTFFSPYPPSAPNTTQVNGQRLGKPTEAAGEMVIAVPPKFEQTWRFKLAINDLDAGRWSAG